MSTRRGKCNTNQSPADAMKVVTSALLSRQFEAGRFQVELADKSSHELVARLKFTRSPGNNVAYPQRVDIMLSLQFVQTSEGSSVNWASQTICTCPEDALIYEIESTIGEAVSDADAEMSPMLAESGDIVAKVTAVEEQLHSSNQPVEDPQPYQRDFTQFAAPDTNQIAVRDDVVSDGLNVPMCDRCKSPRNPTYNFCLNCGHSFDLTNAPC